MRKIISLILIFTVCFFVVVSGENTDRIINEISEILYFDVEPDFGSVGGEWTVFSLARGEQNFSDFFNRYYSRIYKLVRDNKGVISSRKNTEYSRLILALTSIGKNPQNVAGYNLLMPLSDYEKTIKQGLNGAIWALISLDSKNYDIPFNEEAEKPATREMYINKIISEQNKDGGWSLGEEASDVDITAMSLIALSKYKEQYEIEKAILKGIDFLSEAQLETGGFSSRGIENSESCAQVLTALCELGISINDIRFVKNSKTITDALLSYYKKGEGFSHLPGSEVNKMATEQCLYALVSYNRFINNKPSLFNMEDAVKLTGFVDTINHKNEKAINCLKEKGIINGKSDDVFDPDGKVTRAEFCTMIVKGLKLNNKTSQNIFMDVSLNDWFYLYVSCAYYNEIVKGISDTLFNPMGNITREEAVTMLQRGLGKIKDELPLSKKVYNKKISDWAESSYNLLFSFNIIDDEFASSNPKENISRAETAQLIYNFLTILN